MNNDDSTTSTGQTNFEVTFQLVNVWNDDYGNVLS